MVITEAQKQAALRVLDALMHHQDLEFGRQKGQVVAGPGHFGGKGANYEVEDFSCDPSMTERCEECRIASPNPRNYSWSATALAETRPFARSERMDGDFSLLK